MAGGINDHFNLVPKGSGGGIERSLVKVVPYFRDFRRDRLSLSRAEIQCLAVRRESREGLPQAVFLDRRLADHLVVQDIIYLEVRIEVEYLDELFLAYVEALAGRIRGKCHELSSRMPVRVHAESQGRISLRIECLHHVAQFQERGAVAAADVQAQGIRVAAVIGVTVETAVELGVLQDCLLRVGCKFPFVYPHLAVDLVAGR